MKKWILKAVVQKTISYLPFSNKINYVFQKYVTKGVYLSDVYFLDRLGHAKAHLEAYSTHSKQAIPNSSLEIGTGWYPIVPISFFLVGVEKIYSIDISFLTSKERLKTTIDKLVEHKSQLFKDFDIKADRWATLEALIKNWEEVDIDTILAKLQIIYKIEDARKISLADNSIDLVNSNNTFEHIYPSLLIPILAEFKRVVNKNHGTMSHFIDMSDHFAHLDKTINIYNFLQFSESQWSKIDNSIQPQSRLRMDDYEKIYEDLQIPVTEKTFRPGDLKQLSMIELHDEYSGKPLDIVAISHCHFSSKMS